MRNAPRSSRRRGFVLPAVVVVMLLVSMLSLGAVTVAWRTHRAARLGAAGIRAQLAAEEGLALQLDRWPRDSVAALPLGMTLRATVMTAIGDRVHVDVVRTQPLVVWVRARVRLDRIGTPGHVQRVVQRALWLAPPAVPVPAALTVFGVVRGQGQSGVSGTDIPSGADDCGPRRDSASVAPVVASALEEGPAMRWAPGPAWLVPADSTAMRAQVARVWPALVAESQRVRRDSTPFILAPLPGWHSQLLVGSSVILRGISRWRGLLSIAGDLVVQDVLEVDGLLVVRGRLDARAGALRVRGAVLVVPPEAIATPPDGGRDADLGERTVLSYNQCAVQLALATAAEPWSAPFLSWLAPPY